MLILGLDTSTSCGSIALVDSEKPLGEWNLNVRKTHVGRLLPGIQHLLGETGIEIGQIDGFAVAVGPGSFTGLRIALTTAKTLSLVTGKPLAGIPTLDVLVENVPFTEGLVCPALDAEEVRSLPLCTEKDRDRRNGSSHRLSVGPSGDPVENDPGPHPHARRRSPSLWREDREGMHSPDHLRPSGIPFPPRIHLVPPGDQETVGRGSPTSQGIAGTVREGLGRGVEKEVSNGMWHGTPVRTMARLGCPNSPPGGYCFSCPCPRACPCPKQERSVACQSAYCPICAERFPPIVASI